MHAVIIISYSSFGWLNNVLALAKHLSTDPLFKKITILDLQPIDFFHDHYFSSHLEGQIREKAESNGWNYLNAKLGKFGWSKLVVHIGAANLDRDEKAIVVEQLRGEAKKSVGRMYLYELFAKAHFSYYKSKLNAVKDDLAESSSEETWLFVGNGKDVLSSYLASSSRKSISGVRYFETAPFVSKGRLYLGEHKIHDREGHQQAAEKFKLTKNAAEKIANQWLMGRIGAPADDAVTVPKDLGRFNAFFDTSEFEYSYLRETINVFPFDSQYEGFEYALTRFDSTGATTVFRVHPNLVNGSALTQVKTVLRILKMKRRFPGLRIVWHFSEVDSYDLIKQAKRVVFSSSTIGFESLVAGKEVWRLGTSLFDKFTRIPHIMESDPESNVHAQQRAGAFLNYFESNSFPLADDEIDPKCHVKFRARLRMVMLSFLQPSYLFKIFWISGRQLSPWSGLLISKAIIFSTNIITNRNAKSSGTNYNLFNF